MKQSGMPGWLVRSVGWAAAMMAVLSFSHGLSADLPSPQHHWKFDIVHLHTGRVFQGLVLKETAGTVTFQCIWQNPGERTKLGPVTTFARQEILRLASLDTKERAELEARLKQLKPAAEAERMARIELQPAPWRGQADAGLTYTSDHFVLISNAREEIVRRVGVRLDQIYEAYARYLPPRCQNATRTQILLVRSTAEYRQLLQKQVGDLLNPAYFDPATNQIVCATDLQELGDELDRLRKKHQEWNERLKEQQALLLKIYKGNPPAEALEKLRQEQMKLKHADEKNAAKFEQATQRLFQTLYHEAFHAYLAGFVYPPSEYEVPRWLNEGLAQIFETAILEAGELRVGHADPRRLQRVKEALRRGQLIAVADLLKADSDKFLVAHAASQQISDDYYLGSWALAFYLTFRHWKLGTPELDEYVRSSRNRAEPLGAFAKLVSEPLPSFEEAFHRYVRDLQPDGTTIR